MKFSPVLLETIERLVDGLDPAARREFGAIERTTLQHTMAMCQMDVLPEVTGDPNGERCSGEMICDRCGRTYYQHPMDWRVIGYGDVPFLNVICDGRRVKL